MVILHRPERCARCQCPWDGADGQPQTASSDPHPRGEAAGDRVSTAPPGLHRLWRSDPGGVPAGVPRGGFGPRVQAITAWWTGAYHRSRRTTQRVLEDLCGIAIGLGTVANLEQATAQALAEPVAEARTSGQAQPAAYLDETGWREGRQRAWLWTAATACVTVFVVRLSRSAKGAQELLGERFWADLGTDRWSAYTWYLRGPDPAWRRQGCGAHLLRVRVMIERGGPSPAIGEALQAQARPRCHWWHRVRDGTLAPTTFARDCGPFGRRSSGVWTRARPVGSPRPKGPAERSSHGARRCGPVCATPRASQRTTPRSGPSVPACSGAKAALAPRALKVPALSKR